MPSLDVFKSSAFSMLEMTASVNRAPYQPGILGASGLFQGQGIRTTDVMVERKGSSLALLPGKRRGEKGTARKTAARTARNFTVPHVPYEDTILAASLQNVRAFGSETELEAMSDVVNEALERMRQDHEATHEYYRTGAIQGVIKDGDMSTTLVDLFTEFGLAQTSVDFVLGTSTTDVKGKCESVRRSVEDALGNQVYRGITAYCGDTFWDKFVAHDKVYLAFERWNQGDFFRTSQREAPSVKGGFEFCGIYWVNYRGKVAGTPFIPAVDCRFVVEGVPGLFIERYAPADFADTVNTKGIPVYAAQELLPFNRGVDIHTQSNVLCLCTQPETLIRGFTSN